MSRYVKTERVRPPGIICEVLARVDQFLKVLGKG